MGSGDPPDGLDLDEDELTEGFHVWGLGPGDYVVGPATASSKRMPGILATADATSPDLATSAWMST
jgi:hypothetical protein